MMLSEALHPGGVKGYGEGADEKNRAQESSQDGEPLGRSQLLTEHLHASKYQHWQQTGQN